MPTWLRCCGRIPIGTCLHCGDPSFARCCSSTCAGLATPEQALALWQKAPERFDLNEQPVDGRQVLALAIATGCSTYDAKFGVLARQVNCTLLQFDRKLLQLFPDLAIKPGS
jgi:predicted nucleic acid-binding protein